jgi:hypothetical protein
MPTLLPIPSDVPLEKLFKHKPVASPTPTLFLNSAADYPYGKDPDQGKKI